MHVDAVPGTYDKMNPTLTRAPFGAYEQGHFCCCTVRSRGGTGGIEGSEKRLSLAWSPSFRDALCHLCGVSGAELAKNYSEKTKVALVMSRLPSWPPLQELQLAFEHPTKNHAMEVSNIVTCINWPLLAKGIFFHAIGIPRETCAKNRSATSYSGP